MSELSTSSEPPHFTSTRRGTGSLGHRWRSTKEKYHHGSLVADAIKHGLALVGKFGPMAITLRGVARDLGVTAAALVYFFHNRSGLRAAIANAAAEKLHPFTNVRSGGIRAGERLRGMAVGTADFAAANPNLYRLIYGEGWRDDQPPTPVRRQMVFSADRISNMGQKSRHISPAPNREHAWLFYVASHGLAMARADRAVPADLVDTLIDRFVDGLLTTPERCQPAHFLRGDQARAEASIARSKLRASTGGAR